MAVAITGLLILTLAAFAAALVGQLRFTSTRRRLDRAVRTDPLTGLQNRAALAEALTAARDRAERTAAHAAVVAVRLHRFELINETYGPEIGDGLLGAVGRQLSNRRRPGEVVIRDAGPQFIVVLTAADRDELHRRCAEVGAAAAVPYAIGHDHIRVTMVIGAALDGRADPSRDLLADAELAREQAARGASSGTAIVIHDERPRASGSSSIPDERRLRQALDRGQLRLHYLPVVELASGRLAAVEARLAWEDPERGTVIARDLLGQLQETGLIVPVAWWVLEEACRENRAWQDRFAATEVRTITRVAPQLLAHAELADRVLGIVERTGVSVDRLCLEIPESVSGGEVEEAWRALRPLKEAGVLLSLAEFGIGYSSLRYLRSFQLDLLKIDRSFVESIGSNRVDDALVEQLVNLCHALGIAALAEGVDSEHQATLVRSLRCDYATGALVGEPMPADGIDELLAAGTVRLRRPGTG